MARRHSLALGRVVAVRPGEARALLWSFAYFFCLLAGYYVLRPLRDEMGIAGGVRNLPWLFTATFVVMLAAVPVFGAVVARLPRRRFIPLVYHFFVANIAIFWLLLTFDIGKVHVARVFFVWISVFNLFAVSVFWSFMADLFASEQGKRLFGFIAAGGSAGALLGPARDGGARGAARPGQPAHRRGAVAGAGGAVRAPAGVGGAAPKAATCSGAPKPRLAPPQGLGGGWLAGIAMVLRSPYLAGIALWVSLLSLAGTFLYFQQANIVAAASDDPAVRTRIFATIDLAIGHPHHRRAVLRDRTADRALRRGARGGVPAAGLRPRLPRARFHAGAARRHRLPGDPAHRQLRHLESGARESCSPCSTARRNTRRRT